MATTAIWVAVATLGTAVGGLLSKWIDRWVTARVQWRVGPPLLQPFYDLAKLFSKEAIVPDGARRTGFLLAPLLGLTGAVVAVALIWLANLAAAGSSSGGFVGDLIVILYVLTIPAVALILGAASSGSPHGGVGAAREMKLLISYELPMMICLLVAVVKSAQLGQIAGLDAKWTFRLDDMIRYQAAWPVAGSLSGVIAVAMALFCMHAKLGLVPFDHAGRPAAVSDQRVLRRLLPRGGLEPALVRRAVRADRRLLCAGPQHEPAGEDCPGSEVLLVRDHADFDSGAGSGAVGRIGTAQG